MQRIMLRQQWSVQWQITLMTIVLIGTFGTQSVGEPNSAKPDPMPNHEIKVTKVWDEAKHNAFTDIIRYKGLWFITFREAEVHIVPAIGVEPGKARILRSEDGVLWESIALLEMGEDQDIRDPKLSITPDGRLMLNAAVAPHQHPKKRRSVIWLSNDGRTWTEPQRIGEEDWWIWRITWGPNDIAYGVGYGPYSNGPFTTRLYRSRNGETFDTFVKHLTSEPGTNETTIRFLRDGTAVAIVRRDGEDPVAQIGTARGDLTKWTFSELNVRIGGPNVIQLPDGRIVVAGREYADEKSNHRTSLYWLNLESRNVEKFLTLPSSGDTSYPGLAWHDGELWVSYYSSHETSTSIYLARVKLTDMDVNPRDQGAHHD